MKQNKSELEKYIIEAKKEVKNWPEWKRKHVELAFSEETQKQEKNHKK